MKNIKLTYLAGLFDGEGCICIQRQKRKSGLSEFRYDLSIDLAISDKKIPLLFKSKFGGSIYEATKENKQYKYKYYQWHIRNNKADKFLKKLLPYLITKKDEALLAIKFQNMKLSYPHYGGCYLKPKELWDKEENMYQLMKGLKHSYRDIVEEN